ncbi:MAG: hypothetical protein ACOYMR_09575 [Ilumatobacteraceae bacterium]
MLRFQWDALRVGDHVLVHDDSDHGLSLRDGTVRFVETSAGHPNDIGIRLDADGAMTRPRFHAVHLTPLDHRVVCWRCDATA